MPAPIIPSFLGTSVKFKAPVLLTIFLDHLAKGSSIGFDPVARIIFFASRTMVSSL